VKPIPQAVKKFIADAPVCRFATVRQSGDPHVIPVCPVYDGDSTLFVDVAENGVSARAIAANASVTVVIDEYDDDWSKLKAVILRCSAEPLHGDEMDSAWRLFRAKFPQGDAIGWSARLTLALRIHSWTEWGITQALPYQPE
jgi:nitroimidazol reductase NimA-like FMN-containing flavoprotein (pyridoxamine 5'-phosphate oxidase superfamily)